MNTKFVPALSKECSQDWNGMTGDHKRRFCEQCQLHVHNLSAMTAAEQQTVLAGRSTRHCIVFDATEKSIRVHTSTWLLLQKLLRPWRALTALLALTLPAGLTSCATTPPAIPPSPQTAITSGGAAPEIRSGKTTGGVPVYDPPLWRRIIFFWER